MSGVGGVGDDRSSHGWWWGSGSDGDKSPETRNKRKPTVGRWRRSGGPGGGWRHTEGVAGGGREKGGGVRVRLFYIGFGV